MFTFLVLGPFWSRNLCSFVVFREGPISLACKQSKGNKQGWLLLSKIELGVSAISRATVDTSCSFFWDFQLKYSDFISFCGSVAVSGLGGAALGRAVAISCPHLCEADST